MRGGAGPLRPGFTTVPAPYGPWAEAVNREGLCFEAEMDEYEFLEAEAGSGERGSGGRNREVTPLRKQQGQQGGGGGQGGNNRANSTNVQESPLRRALEQPPLKRFKVTFNPSLAQQHTTPLRLELAFVPQIITAVQ